MNFDLLCANAIFIIHWAYIAVVVGGFVCILAGFVRSWTWTRNFWFRLIHLLMMAFVVWEVWQGMECALTTWEREYRHQGGQVSFQGDFITDWALHLFNLEMPSWAWDLAYYSFGGLILLVFMLHPPRLPGFLRGTAVRADGQFAASG